MLFKSKQWKNVIDVVKLANMYAKFTLNEKGFLFYNKVKVSEIEKSFKTTKLIIVNIVKILILYSGILYIHKL